MNVIAKLSMNKKYRTIPILNPQFKTFIKTTGLIFGSDFILTPYYGELLHKIYPVDSNIIFNKLKLRKDSIETQG